MSVSISPNLLYNSTDDYSDLLLGFDLFANISNSTVEPPAILPTRDLWREIPLGIVLACLSLVTFIGNAMVLHAVRTERRLQSVSNMFIVSLAIADLTVGLVVMPMSTVYIFTDDWLFGVAVCQIWIGIDYTASTASILNLFILSVDRYWSVTSPLKYLRKRTKRRAFIMISLVWFVSSFWIIPIAGWHHFFHGGVRYVPSDVCDTEYAKNSALKVITAFFNFFLPLAVMYFLYWKIFQEIRKRSEMELGQRNVKHKYSAYNSYLPPQIEDLSYSDHRDANSDITSTHVDSTHLAGDMSNYELTSRQPLKDKRAGYLNMRLKPLLKSTNRRHHADRRNEIHNTKCKVEYVYDESVLDEETEKVERYFYEAVIPITPSPARNASHTVMPNSTVGHLDNSFSSPSTPVSSCSSADDKLSKANEKEKYSLLSGLKQIRQAETILDSTVIAANSNERDQRNDRNTFVFRDERNRRVSHMFNLKDRIRHIRQSSSLTKEIKAARQLGVIMGAFTVCFLPYFVLFLVVAFCDGCVDQSLTLALTWVGYLNSTLNPFLYPLCNLNFRRKFRMMFGLRNKRGKHRKRHGYDKNHLTTGVYD